MGQSIAAPRPNHNHHESRLSLVGSVPKGQRRSGKALALKEQQAKSHEAKSAKKGLKRSPDGHSHSAPSGYGAAAAPVCTTVYEDECATVNEQQCSTVNEE